MSLHNPISPLHAYYVQKVLPAVYDDSLSYYEILCKVQETLNEVVSTTNEQSVVVLEMQQAINDFIHGGYTDTFEEYLDEWFEENSDAFVQRLIDEGIIPEVAAIQSDLTDVHTTIDGLTETKVPYPLMDYTPSYGTSGQVLATNADGTTDWQDPVIPSDAQAEQVITQWLNDHPEATTTVQDGAVTTAKLANGAVTDAKLANGAVTDAKLAQIGLKSTLGELWDTNPLATAQWEQGVWTDIMASPSPRNSDTRIRTYVELPAAATKIKLSIGNSNMKYIYGFYDTTNTLVSGNATWSDATISITGAVKKIYLAVKKVEDGVDVDIAPSDIVTAEIVCTINDGLYNISDVSKKIADVKIDLEEGINSAKNDLDSDIRSAKGDLAELWDTNPLAGATWEQGGWTNINSNPSPIASGTRIRTSIVLPVAATKIEFEIRNTANMQYIYGFYDSSDNLVAGSATWGTRVLKVTGSIKKIYVALRYSNPLDGDIKPYEYANAKIKCVINDLIFSLSGIPLIRNIWELDAAFRKSIYPCIIDAFYANGCFEQGSINPNTGADVEPPAASRIRSDYIDLTGKTQIVVICDSDVTITSAIIYNSSREYLGSLSMTSAISILGNGLRQVLLPITTVSAKYIRVVLRPEPDATIYIDNLHNYFYYFGTASPFEEEKNSLKIMSYNVGRYSWGVSPYAMTSEQYASYIYNWRRYLGNSDCDVLFLQENGVYLDLDNQHASRSDLFNPIYPYYSEASNFTAIESKLQFVHKGTGNFTDGRRYSYAIVNVGSKQVYMLSIHLKNENQSDVPSSASIRETEMQEILTLISPYTYAVIAGDTNIANFSELSTLTNGGLTACNHGFFGDWWTYSFINTDYSHYDTPSEGIRYFDNVFVTSNIRVDDFYADNVYSKLTSDHIPIIAKLTLT